MELKDYLRVMRQRWMSIVAVALIGLFVAGIYTTLQTPQFRSKSQIFVSVKDGSTSTDVIQGSTFAEKRVISYVNLVTSPTVLRAVAEKLRLEESPGQLAGKVVATTPPQTVLIDITATDPSAKQAANIANETARQLILAVERVDDVSLVQLSVFEEATPAAFPASPRVAVNLAIGFVLGVAIGLGVAFLREILNTRIRSQADVERTITAGILGSFSNDPSAENEALVTQSDHFSHRSESFRQLRTHLHFTNLDGGSQTIVVSSSIPGEGKTSTSVNLAIMFAESGVRVLIIDADLRRPRVAKYLGLEGSIGLSGVLSHSVSVEDAIQTWGHGGILHVLASGRSAPNPSELLGSPSMAKLISRFESEYDVVIIDSPPLLPVTDPAVLGSMASGVLLIVSADGRTRRSELEKAVKDLDSVNARLLGIAINRVAQTQSDQNYYDYRPETVESGSRAKNKAISSARRAQ